MSLEQHSALIEQLKPLLMETDFDELFERLTASESNSTRFLLKMELKRIAAACTRIIDLRDKSELPCFEVKMGKQTHFLDEPAKVKFDEAVALYQDNYTLGVYEQVLEAHKQRRLKLRNLNQSNDAGITPYVANGVVLGSFFNRSEERMNYAIRISVSQDGRNELSGVTADLSVGGARIRIPAAHQFVADKPIRVKLLGLSDEYYDKDLQQGIDYQIVDSEKNPEHCWFRLKRLSGSEGLAKMLGNLIQGYKFRYKVDINDVLTAAIGLGFERHYLPHLPHLPLYVEQIEDSGFQITHKLLSRDNQAIQQAFQDENEISQLPSMLTPARLNRLLTKTDNPDHSLFFCFTFQTKGCIFFYSASLAELKQQNLLALFLGFGCTKSSWRVFKVAQHKIDHQKSYKSSMLPGDDSRYSSLVESQLQRFSHVLQLIDLTNEDQQASYQQWQQYSNEAANALKPFGQPKCKANSIKLLSLQFTERRNEARFSFKTYVKVSQGKVVAEGFTQDISSKGLQLTVAEAANFDTTAPVMLSFPKLQSLAGKTKLSQLPYRLIRTRRNGVTMHLAAMMGHTPHVGVEFLNKLIIQNRDKLEKLTEANSDKKELSDGLKNLLMRQLGPVPYFIEKTAKSMQLTTIGLSQQRNEVSDIFAASAADTLQYNLEPLLSHNRLKTDFIEPIRQMKPQHGLDYFEVFVQISRQSQGQIKAKCLQPHLIGDSDAQVHFIKQSQHLGRFMALRIYRGATGKPDLNYIRRELAYINVHAQHKAKELERRLWRIVGVGELLEITQEVQLRYPTLYQELVNAPLKTQTA
ncbi:PilZ domain-containing protein [Shewanella sp. Scap07]|uniref:PilZ domain-containing protein n=1 Tax=Shewanella sp. Scap07 TaxID=2589987 RepID=UPI0015B8E2F5|nr:PilZ domain-containing protein [Shewanella sp. Scap07]QLE86359.1 PilZ domain-containing protein [Shewanella sp. Scap07]